MYLEKIEIHGFKSFADAIKLQIPLGITAIIGPNGSGKSNVADAIRWALGEQSAKSLRGSKMEDVIFLGTDKRKSQGYAEVALTINNSDKKLPIDYVEVVVKRRVYRSGESEYFINGSSCRLKDIQELFMDTGIGKEGYSIIGQGQIDRILISKPEERRALFEEAAGIYKYKVRRQEAEKKLEKERENLIRVQDIINELEDRLGPLRIESQKASEFLLLRDKLKITDINIFLYEMKEIEKELATILEKYQDAELELEEQEKLKITQNQLQKHLKEQREMLYQNAEAKLQTITDIEKQKATKQTQIHLNEEKISSTIKLIEQIQKEQLEHQERQQTRQEKLNALTLKIKDLKEEELSKQNIVHQEEIKLQSLEKEQNNLIEQNKTLENQYHEALRKKDRLEADIQKNKDIADTMKQRDEYLNEQLTNLNTEILKQVAQKETLDKKQVEYQALLEQLEQECKKVETQRNQILSKKATLENENQVIQQNKLQLERQIEWLKQLRDENEGYFNSVKQVLKIAQKEKMQGIIDVVGNLLEVPKRYEVAILTALGSAVQNIVTQQEKDARAMIEIMKKRGIARVTFLPLDTVQAYGTIQEKELTLEKGYIGIASELVQYDQKYQTIIKALLGKIIVIDQMENASVIAKKYRYKYKLVTLQGEIFNPGGSLSGGSTKNQGNNLFSRSRELKQAQEKLDTFLTNDEALTELTKELEGVTRQYQEITSTYEAEKQKAQQVSLEQDKVTHYLKLNQERYQQLSEEYQEIEQIKADKTKLNSDNQAHFESLETYLSTNKQERELLNAKQETLQKDYQAINKTLVAEQIDLSTIRQTITHIEEQLKEISETANHYEEKQVEFQKEIATYKTNVENLKGEMTTIQEQIKQDIISINKIQEELKNYDRQKVQIEQQEETIEQQLKNTIEQVQLLQQESYRLKTQQENKESRKQTWLNQMWEKYELTYNHAFKYKNKISSITTLREQATSLKNSMKTLGDVHIQAIEECKEVEERYTFLVKQKTDIEKAADGLIKMIEQFTIEMKEIFKVQFSIIANSFSEVFKELFGGGEAYLELTDEEHILESGIEIIAKPPGKKLQNMTLLSGGERTLTAISLIFGILKLKPSPFCLLDEIEAALDEANVIRFAQYLDKLSQKTQFIVITHRKGTMTYAHTLYGITQKEKGVSTVLSVQLEEAYQYAKQDKKIGG